MKNLPVSAVGMVWYALEDFDRIKAIMEDAHLLLSTYTQWRLNAEQGESGMRRQGQFVVRAHLRPDEFIEWCRVNGQKLDANGRIQFANEVAIKAYRAAN